MSDIIVATSPAVLSTSSTSSSSSSKRLSYKAKLPEDFQPGQWTVICGIRGKQCRESSGNIKLKELVKENLIEYSQAKNKADKSMIVSKIMDTIKSASPTDGVFAKQDETTKVWYEVSDAFSREKIGCVFRDLLHNQYSSSTKAKHERKKALRRQQKQHRVQQQMLLKQRTTSTTEDNTAMTSSSSSSSFCFGKKYNMVEEQITTGLVNLLHHRPQQYNSSSSRPHQQQTNNIHPAVGFAPSFLFAGTSSSSSSYQQQQNQQQADPLSLIQEACQILNNVDDEFAAQGDDDDLFLLGDDLASIFD